MLLLNCIFRWSWGFFALIWVSKHVQERLKWINISKRKYEVRWWCNICKTDIFSWWPLHNIFINLPHTSQLRWRETKQAVGHILNCRQRLPLHPGAHMLTESTHLLHHWLSATFPWLPHSLGRSEVQIYSLSGSPNIYISITAKSPYIFSRASWHLRLCAFCGYWSPPTLYLHHLPSQNSHITRQEVS